MVSFGPDRSSVHIAHEAIDGYLEATTTTFESWTPDKLATFSDGDRVLFSFRPTEGGHRVLDSIEKE